MLSLKDQLRAIPIPLLTRDLTATLRLDSRPTMSTRPHDADFHELTTGNTTMFFRIFLLCLFNGLFAVVWSCDRPPASETIPPAEQQSSAAPAASAKPSTVSVTLLPAHVDLREHVLIFARFCQCEFQALCAAPTCSAPVCSAPADLPAGPTPVLDAAAPANSSAAKLQAMTALESLLVPVHDWSARFQHERRDMIPLEPQEMFVSLTTLEDLARARTLRKLTAVASLTRQYASGAAEAFSGALRRTSELAGQWRAETMEVLRDRRADSPRPEMLGGTHKATSTR